MTKRWSMIRAGLLIALTMPLLLTSCSRYGKEREFVEAIGTERLTAYASDLERKDVWKAAKGQLPKDMWHETFASHGVLEVKRYFAGVQIVLDTRGRKDRGVYIVADRTQTPEDGSGIHFEKLADGVYGFEEKNRVQYIPLEKRNSVNN